MNQRKRMRLAEYQALNQYVRQGETLFCGSSLCEFFPIYELAIASNYQEIIYNRGVAGFVLSELRESISTCILDLKPSRIFMNIGSNDLGAADFSIEIFLSNYKALLSDIRSALPDTEIIIIAYYPMNTLDRFEGVSEQMKDVFVYRNNQSLKFVNEKLSEMVSEQGCTFLDLNDQMTNEHQQLKADFSTDGVHLTPEGYAQIFANLLPYL